MMTDDRPTEGVAEAAVAPPQMEIDPLKVKQFIQQLKDNQNLGLGILGGLGGAAIGAAIWAGVTAATHFQIGWMAIGVGFLVGYGVRKLGQGIDSRFGVAGAILALLGCMAGNLLAVCIMVSSDQNIPFFDLLSRLDPNVCYAVMKETFHVMDILFYGIAIYEGYKFSIRRVTEEELRTLVK